MANIYGLKRRQRYRKGDYIMFRYGYKIVLGMVSYSIRSGSKGIVEYKVVGIGEPFVRNGRTYDIRTYRKCIYGLCDDPVEVMKLKLAGVVV